MSEVDEPHGVPWRSFFDEACERLTTAVSAPAAEARWIVEQASGFEGGDFVGGLDSLATQRGVAHFDSMMQRRLAGEPVQYVLGRWPFRELDLAVDRRALIPRPETEIVCGLGLDELARQAEGRADGLVAVDLGVGTGAIALSLAFERADVEVVGSEIDAEALALARANVAGLGRAGARVRLVEGAWFEPLPGDLKGRCNLVISNPPYIARSDELPSEVVDWEPARALFSDDDGFADAAFLIEAAPPWLVPGGALVLELGETQLDRAAAVAVAAGFVDVTIHPDLAGKPRGLVARRP